MDMITIPANIDGLKSATNNILPEKWRKPVLASLDDRIRWENVLREFQELRDAGMQVNHAILELAERHHYSEKTIEAIIYSR